MSITAKSEPKKTEKKIMKFAGLWKDLDTDRLLIRIYSSRMDCGSVKKN